LKESPKDTILRSYKNDSICGTWEVLANAVYPDGASALNKLGYQAIGQEKSKWAQGITPNLKLDDNGSPSFNRFKDKLRALVAEDD